MGVIEDEAKLRGLLEGRQTVDGLDEEVVRAITSKETPIWLARAMDHGLKCNPVDTTHYFATAAEMFQRRVDRIFKEAGVDNSY